MGFLLVFSPLTLFCSGKNAGHRQGDEGLGQFIRKGADGADGSRLGVSQQCALATKRQTVFWAILNTAWTLGEKR